MVWGYGARTQRVRKVGRKMYLIRTSVFCFTIILFIVCKVGLVEGEEVAVIWSQRPDMQNNEVSISTNYGSAVSSSDFIVSNSLWDTTSLWPVKQIKWWGAYLDGYDPGNNPSNPGFLVTLSFDVPPQTADPVTGEVLPFSHPGDNFTSFSTRVQESFFGVTNNAIKLYEYTMTLGGMSTAKPQSPIYWIALDYLDSDPITFDEHLWGWAETSNLMLGHSISNPAPELHVGPWADATVLTRDLALEIIAVPEPATLSLLAVGCTALIRRKSRSIATQ